SFFLPRPPPPSPLFPYTTLFRSGFLIGFYGLSTFVVIRWFPRPVGSGSGGSVRHPPDGPVASGEPGQVPAAGRAPRRTWRRAEGDRKSTRLNSSHVAISYAVFCL